MGIDIRVHKNFVWSSLITRKSSALRSVYVDDPEGWSWSVLTDKCQRFFVRDIHITGFVESNVIRFRPDCGGTLGHVGLKSERGRSRFRRIHVYGSGR